MSIDELLDREGHNHVCEHCPYYFAWEERHCYGDGFATEQLCECRAKDDFMCPRLEEG